jgi:diguanylate cyclase (GGDEF)-like protein
MAEDLVIEDYDLEYLLAEVPPNKREILKKIITIDPLTGLLNTTALSKTLSSFSSRIKRGDFDIKSIISVFGDIDHFKHVNDTYGHFPSGNSVLAAGAQTLKKELRDYDINTIYRFGGEEFLMLLFNRRLKKGQQITERLRKSVEKNCRFYVGPGNALYQIQDSSYLDSRGESHIVTPQDTVFGITMSFGIAIYEKGKDDFETLIARSTQAMKYAKNHGRNQVATWTPELQSTSSK